MRSRIAVGRNPTAAVCVLRGMTPITLRRTRPLLLSVLVLLILAGGGAAAAPASGGVVRADFPRAEQLTRVYPFLEGGRREVSVAEGLDVRSRDCVSFGRVFDARSVRFASYLMRDGDAPYFQGREDPTFFVYEFASPARARSGLARIADYAERCAGRHRSAGTHVTLRPVEAPRLGRRQVAYRTATTSGRRSPARELEIYVLRDNRIERTWIQRDTKAISAPHAIAMARILARTAGEGAGSASRRTCAPTRHRAELQGPVRWTLCWAAWARGRITSSSTFTWRGRVTIHTMASATSSATSGSATPA